MEKELHRIEAKRAKQKARRSRKGSPAAHAPQQLNDALALWLEDDEPVEAPVSETTRRKPLPERPAASPENGNAPDEMTERLRRLEAQAREAESRAQSAEHIAQVGDAYLRYDYRLREVLERIATADARIEAAQRRAHAALERVHQPLPPRR
jgi:hypothetical protein